MNVKLDEALRIGDAVHASGLLRLRDGRPEAIWVNAPASGWHPVPREHLRTWPEGGWEPAGALQDGAPEIAPGKIIRAGNLLAYDFRHGLMPDGRLSHLGFDWLHQYAKLWKATGQRDLELEAAHPELAEDFRDVREDEERLAFHLLEDHLRDRTGELLLFTGFSCRLEAPENMPVERLVERADGTLDVDYQCAPQPDEEADVVRDLLPPRVAAVRLIRVGEEGVAVPCRVILDKFGDAWASHRSLDEARELLTDRSRTGRRPSRTAPLPARSATGQSRIGEPRRGFAAPGVQGQLFPESRP